MPEIRVRKRKPPSERIIDKTIEDSFPASDPPAIGHTDRPGTPKDTSEENGDQRDSERRD